MKTKFAAVAGIAGLLVMLSPLSAFAAVDRAVMEGIGSGPNPGQLFACAHYMDGSTETSIYCSTVNIGSADNSSAILTASVAAVQSDAAGFGYTLTKGVVWPFASIDQVNAAIASATSSLATVARTGSYNDLLNLPVAPSSYQTIVSQTGTAAPAVAGGLTPMNSYSGSPTFTWARTGAGVYTLTASSAVFNTSGKTGVFVAPLQNLNASVRAVVTSTTVITVTTAVQSVAVLGLLGLTTTATDALLSGTMIYVQTYP